MNIESSNINQTTSAKSSTKATQNSNSSAKFSDELKELAKEEKVSETETPQKENVKEENSPKEDNNGNVDDAYEGLNSVVKELQQKDLNQSEDKKRIQSRITSFLPIITL